MKGTRRAWPLASVVLLVLLLPTVASSQSMSFSIYTDVTIDTSGRIHADITGYDNSSGCSHWNHSLPSSIYGPNGGNTSTSGWSAVSLNLLDDDGDYTIVSNITVNCSCMGGMNYTVSGSNTTANRSRFRAVWDYKQPNGSLHQYNAKCTHSCQPSRVCIDSTAPFAFMEGFKLVTPAISVCRPSSPVLTSSSYSANPCLGSGSYGFSGGFDHGCPF